MTLPDVESVFGAAAMTVESSASPRPSASTQGAPRWNATGEEPDQSVQERLEKLPLVDKAWSSTRKLSKTPLHVGSDILNHPRLWLQSLEDHFGYGLLMLLFVVQFLGKGFALEFTSKAEVYLYGAYHVSAPQMQIYQGVTKLPWAVKPAVGLLSDMFPIRGSNKAPYMIFVSFCGLAAVSAIGLGGRHGALSVTALVICLTVLQMHFSTTDLLSEAKYAEKIKQNPSFGPDLLTYVWFGMNFGALVAVILSGPALLYLAPQASYLLASVPLGAVLYSLFRGHLEENQQSEEAVALTRARMFEQKEIILLCVLMFLGASTMTVSGICIKDPLANCVASVSVALVMLVSFSLFLSPVIAKANAFFLIQTSLHFSIGGATFYFFTDGKEQYPAMDDMVAGPHFDKFFYNSVMGAVGIVFSLLGVASYSRWMKTWTYRNLLIFTNVVHALLNLVDVLIFTRYNLHLGIPDHAFVLGSSVMESVIDAWRWMPGVVMMSFLCPKGMEATMYALLAGCHNLGGAVSSSCGALLLERLGCRPDGSLNETKQFENLWVASLLSTLLPLATIMLLFWLIPNAHQAENLVAHDEESATAGSIWQRWVKG